MTTSPPEADPDVLLVLEEVRITATSETPHYTLTLTGEHSNYALEDWRSAYNIKYLEYGPNHDDLKTDLEGLLEQVLAFRQTSPNG